jgi:hypothetical protein
MHFLARDSFDGGGIALERLHAVLQFSVFLVELVDFLADLLGLLLRAAHRQHAMRPEDILKQEQGQSNGEKPIEIAAKKLAHLLGKCLPRVRLWRVHGLVTHALVSSASFCDAAGEADSV